MIITIDGKECPCEKGEYLLQIARRNGVFIPTLCHHEGLPGQGCCRVCIVEVEQGGRSRVVTACVFPVEAECAVSVNSEKIRRMRGMVLELLKRRAPDSQEVLRLAKFFGAPGTDRFVEQAGERCILCGLCARACDSLGAGAISTVHRGIEKAVSTPYDQPSADCVGCGSCARVCPTGAIEMEEDADSRAIWSRRFELLPCSECGEVIGTREEIDHAAARANREPDDRCDRCRKKALTDVMAGTYGSV